MNSIILCEGSSDFVLFRYYVWQQEEERELPVQWKAGDLEELKKEHIIRPWKSQKVTGCFW